MSIALRLWSQAATPEREAPSGAGRSICRMRTLTLLLKTSSAPAVKPAPLVSERAIGAGLLSLLALASLGLLLWRLSR